MSRGRQVGFTGLGLCLVAGALALSSLYVPGVALVLLALGAEGGMRLAARRVAVTVELDRDSVEEGEECLLRVRASGWPLVLGQGELQSSPGQPWQPARGRAAGAELRLRPRRRGEAVLGPAAVRFADPFGICASGRRSEVRRLLVLPRIESVPRADLEALLGLSDPYGRREDGVGAEGLRPYRPGAPASRIHWPSVARTGVLLERRADREAPLGAVMIAVDPRGAASTDALDEAIRATASLCVALARRGGCSLLLPGFPEARPVAADLSGWARLHAALAVLEAGPELHWRASAGARLLIHVLARRPEPGSAARHAACTLTPLPGPGPVLASIAGCAVQPCPQLARAA